jgi:hypothetical protein
VSSVTDALGQIFQVSAPPRRIVSLVPSETLSVVELVGPAPLLGRTQFCIEPAGALDSVAVVGGTKSVDVEAVCALAPDLVLANKEENARPAVQALIDRGLRVHVSFPCTVQESLAYLEDLCLLLHVDAEQSEALRTVRSACERLQRPAPLPLVPVFVPIWKDPWMTFDGRVYASDLLERCGAHNVFSGRPRLYPLSADLGESAPQPERRVVGRDTRYPRTRIEEALGRGAKAILLPDEPYAFSEADAVALRAEIAGSGCLVEPIDGKMLFWYGTQLARAVDSLIGQIARLSGRLRDGGG